MYNAYLLVRGLGDSGCFSFVPALGVPTVCFSLLLFRIRFLIVLSFKVHFCVFLLVMDI